MSAVIGSSLTFASWNVRGLGKPTKINKVLSHLDSLGVKIAYLQETHLKTSDHMKIRRSWVAQSYHSLFNSKARGTAILIHKSLQFTASNVTADPGGRYVVVTGLIANIPIILANVYAPNWDNDKFFSDFLYNLPNLDTHHLVLGGDFNCCLNPEIDRSSISTAKLSRSAHVINTFIGDYGISDLWRSLNPTGRAYSFFSPVHQSFSRIDYFLVDCKLLQLVEACSYNAIIISDHSPLTATFRFAYHTPRPLWRLGIMALSQDEITQFIARQIDFFIEMNATPDVSCSTLWEALKAFLRGQIISYMAHNKKQTGQQKSDMTNHILQLQTTYAITPSPDLFKELLLEKNKLDIILSSEAEKNILRSRHRYYEFGDKASKILAYQLRQATASKLITKIKTPEGYTYDGKLINDKFKDFYMSLYTSEHDVQPDFNNFFSTLKMPSINEESRNSLDAPITAAELDIAIKSLQTGKSPGPDGFPPEFFKKFSQQLIPHLLNMYNESFTVGILPQTLRTASISLIAKKDKDPAYCASYRPISLLNVDFKILAKVLALRLERVLPQTISADQTGFIKNRYSFFNIRRLFNIIYSKSKSSSPELILSMDAEKAFDRLEWDYLFYTLEKFNVGGQFINWIRLLYTTPLASVCTNGSNSDAFPISRGSRQGCPLSPLLFALALEPLAIAIRQDTTIRGIFREGLEQKISLYADDMILYISNPDASIPKVLSTLDTFGSISGYKLNLQKSEVFPVNLSAQTYPLHGFSFRISRDKFTYLGVHVTNKADSLFKENFTPLVKDLEQSIKRWSSLNLSVAGYLSSVISFSAFQYLFPTPFLKNWIV